MWSMGDVVANQAWRMNMCEWSGKLYCAGGDGILRIYSKPSVCIHTIKIDKQQRVRAMTVFNEMLWTSASTIKIWNSDWQCVKEIEDIIATSFLPWTWKNMLLVSRKTTNYHADTLAFFNSDGEVMFYSDIPLELISLMDNHYIIGCEGNNRLLVLDDKGKQVKSYISEPYQIIQPLYCWNHLVWYCSRNTVFTLKGSIIIESSEHSRNQTVVFGKTLMGGSHEK